MKTLFRTNRYLLIGLGVAGCALIFSCAQTSMTAGGGHKVEITEGMIVMDEPVTLSPADEQAMNAVLKQHSKSLYRVEKVDNGKVTRVKGTLEDASMGPQAAKKKKLKLGSSTTTHHMVCNSGCNEWKPQTAKQKAEKEKLVTQLKPILEKY